MDRDLTVIDPAAQAFEVIEHPHRSPSQETTMSRTDGRAYARHLIDTAQHFLQSAVADYGPMTTEHRYYWTAISIELGLKAWLSLVGFTDDQMRRTVGHDLAIARSLAGNEGLSFPDAAEPVLALVHPFYMQGGFRRPNDVEWPAALLAQTLPFLTAFYAAISNKIAAVPPESISGPATPT